jgi:hypothetical protein
LLLLLLNNSCLTTLNDPLTLLCTRSKRRTTRKYANKPGVWLVVGRVKPTAGRSGVPHAGGAGIGAAAVANFQLE